MARYLIPEELAEQLRVEVSDVMSLIEQGKLRAIQIGSKTRIPETELESLITTSAAGPTPNGQPVSEKMEKKQMSNGIRWCPTRTGRAKFRVAGSVASGADIWPGRMQYPIKFSKQFMDELLTHFQGDEVAVGGQFDNPTRGSLGEFIQKKLGTKMNPGVYLAALLLEEGYADPGRRGYIKFRQDERKRQT
jgi:excisionase family DNA binding protein